MTDRLLRALADADAASAAGLGAEELADVLWLAGCLGGAALDRPQRPVGPADPAADPPPGPGTADGPEPAPGRIGGPLEQHYATADLAAPGGTEPGPGAARGDLVRVARAAALADPLAVMRALRPLGRRTLAHSRGETELDEEATVSAGVDQRLLVPVLRPTPGRWLDLALVIDTHRSMTLWHDLVAELRRVIAQTGVFRDVRTWYLSGTEAGGLPGLAARPGGAPRRPLEIADPSGRRLVLVVTDTVGAGWGGPALDAVLRGWGRHGSVAVLNVLPERLWSRGAVRPTPLWLRATGPAAPNAGWEAAATRPRGRSHRRLRAAPGDGAGTGVRPMPVPVVDPSPPSLAALAALVSGGGRRGRLSCLLAGGAGPVPAVDPAAPPAAAPASPPATAELALKQFRETASPLAQELAGHLSAVPLVLPVMTLVRRAMLPHADHGHLAEVLLGGLLAPWEAPPPGTDPDGVEFDFLPGVRDALLGAQRREDVAEIRRTVRHQVAAYLRSRRTAAADFLAGHVADGTRARAVAPGALPFAESAGGAAGRESPGVALSVAEALERPELLGVKPADHPPDEPGLPTLVPYVRRELDTAVAELVRGGLAGGSTAVLVTGARATGKTRACFEALRRLPAGWRLWRPEPEPPGAGAAGLDGIGPDTVVWLDEAMEVLAAPRAGGGPADQLAELLADRSRGPVLVLGTLRMKDPDDSPRARFAGSLLQRLLDRARVHVPEEFSREEADAAARLDPRLAEAVQVARDRRVVQVVAAAPGLRAGFEQAPVMVRAVLDAALDTLRLGHRRALPDRLLEAAAPGYLSAYGRNNGPEDWFGAAMAYATSQEAGRVGLFRADRRTASGAAADGFSYTMHPLVEGWQHRRRPPGLIPPETLWQALLEHADRGDLLRLAQGARGLGADDRAEAIEAAADAYLTRRLPRLPAVGGEDEEDVVRPYFYLSHAHAPPTEGRMDPGFWVRRLCEDLSDAILQLTNVPDGVPVGMMDDGRSRGASERRAQALATCRVFVPLYSPRYFASVPCGREWHAFTRRQVFPVSADSERSSGIVPVQWTPPTRHRLPETAARLQVNQSGFGPDYAAEGMYALMTIGSFRSAYDLAVHRLARRIVKVAEETVIPVGRVLDLATLPSAFEDATPPRELRILVLAYRRDEVPPGRRTEAYGPRRTDWNPYRGVLARSLAEHTEGLARQWGFSPSVQDFEPEAERLLEDGAPAGPTVLLLDRWALRDTRRFSLLRRVSARNTGWMGVLEPWSADGPGAAADASGPAALSRRALSAGEALRAGQTHSGQQAIGGLDEFEEALPRVVARAERAFREGRWGHPDGAGEGHPRIADV
ncbi:TIR-like protein FxsC [Kitasatospora sp. NBC_00085]|uniref:TIR-like protein FxsC n=1 Tax=unclassified Kitasatospora TaxID=2633591 RepID=UPI0032436209